MAPTPPLRVPTADMAYGPSSPANMAPSPAMKPDQGQQAGFQLKSMGLKVHYTFDKEAQIHCLARHPHPMPLQYMEMEQNNTIGVIELRACVFALIECSPELAAHECDYALYSLDYSEPNNPWVGHGMLSWALDGLLQGAVAQQPKLVTGRVTQNLLSVFGSGIRDTLEVKLKLSASAQVQRPNQHHDPIDVTMANPMDLAMTPKIASEWAAFLESSCHMSAFTQPDPPTKVSPPSAEIPHTIAALEAPFGPSLAHPDSSGQEYTCDADQAFFSQPPAGGNYPSAPAPVPPHGGSHMPTPPVTLSEPMPGVTPSSRASSRASTRPRRRRSSTGRPRGRLRKVPAESTNSGRDDTSDTEAIPLKKRARTTKVLDTVSGANPFASDPESLRVAASTSGSLRSIRPPAVTSIRGMEDPHQAIPRAPTPIPSRDPTAAPRKRASHSGKLRQAADLPSMDRLGSRLQPLSPSQDDSPSPEILAPTPASDDSMLEISSSPPGDRAATAIPSSPPSSPVLPPMPAAPQDSFRKIGLDSVKTTAEHSSSVAPDRLPRNKVAPVRGSSPRMASARNTSKVPMQVFQMQDGPEGQDMVFLRSLNGAPLPSTEQPPAAPAPRPYRQRTGSGSSQNLASLGSAKPAPAQTQTRAPPGKRSRKGSPTSMPPSMQPTPPLTTDSVEKPASPPFPASPSSRGVPPSPAATWDAVQGNLAAEGSEATHQASTDRTNLLLEAPRPPAARSPLPSSRNVKPTRKPKPSGRITLVRSQSSGAEVKTVTATSASEPAGPSSLSRSVAPTMTSSSPPTASSLKRAASSGPLNLPLPFSDSAAVTQQSEATTPAVPSVEGDSLPSPPAPSRSNKNVVKKHAIKQRLEEAIINGEMPPFCSNCGAIETPTWRKIWVQDKEGKPEYFEYSEKPGKVTAIDVLKRDSEEKPMSYRIIKKSLGPGDDKSEWRELLLCNPCGIWLTKCKGHRPPDRWDKDFSRVGQEQRRKGSTRGEANPKKLSRSKSDGGTGFPTSEAYLPTDAPGAVEAPSSPVTHPDRPSETVSCQQDADAVRGTEAAAQPRQAPGSDANPQDSGAADLSARTAIDNWGPHRSVNEVGADHTRRLLFPSPRKDGEFRALGEVGVNVVLVPNDTMPPKQRTACEEKENDTSRAPSGCSSGLHGGLHAARQQGASLDRQCTPPNHARCEEGLHSCQTPRPHSPSHRPVTRSVSRSLRSKRRSPRNLQKKASALASGALGTPFNSTTRDATSSSGLDMEYDLAMLDFDQLDLFTDFTSFLGDTSTTPTK